MDLLGDMPVVQCSFEEAFLFYKERGRGYEFRRAVADYIHITGAPYRKSILDYCKRRQGEWDREKIEEEVMFRRRAKNEEERLKKWNG